MTRVPMPACSSGRDRPATVISPSILSADFAKLAEECKKMVDLGAEWLHVDVMDGHFVPNLTIGAPVVASLRKHTQAFLDVHLMVSNPRQWIDDYAKAGADMYTFHLEAAVPDPGCRSANTAHPVAMEVCTAVRKAGMHCGVALCPHTPVEHVFPYVEAGVVDMVLVMTVVPGFGGQKFMADQASKVAALRERFPTLTIQVDGGVAPSTVGVVAAAGANSLVAGSAIFGAPAPGEVIATLRAAVDQAATKAASS